jgi:hypothetical protein
MSTTLSLVKRHPLATLFVLVALSLGSWRIARGPSVDGRGSVLMRGTRHVDSIDWSQLPLAPWPSAARAGQDRGRRMWRVTSGYLLAFFDRHLKDEPSPHLDGPSPDHPEVVLGAPEVLFEAERPTNAG